MFADLRPCLQRKGEPLPLVLVLKFPDARIPEALVPKITPAFWRKLVPVLWRHVERNLTLSRLRPGEQRQIAGGPPWGQTAACNDVQKPASPCVDPRRTELDGRSKSQRITRYSCGQHAGQVCQVVRKIGDPFGQQDSKCQSLTEWLAMCLSLEPEIQIVPSAVSGWTQTIVYIYIYLWHWKQKPPDFCCSRGSKGIIIWSCFQVI